jgi:hypothetical protein
MTIPARLRRRFTPRKDACLILWKEAIVEYLFSQHLLMSKRDFRESPEISDYLDYETIIQIRDTLKIEKICSIIF